MSGNAKTEVVRFPVFRDEQGNRFVFPGLYNFESRSASWGFCRSICAGLGVDEEKFQLGVIPDENGRLNFPHVVADAGSPGFAHGSSKVWLIGGPEFDDIERTSL